MMQVLRRRKGQRMGREMRKAERMRRGMMEPSLQGHAAGPAGFRLRSDPRFGQQQQRGWARKIILVDRNSRLLTPGWCAFLLKMIASLTTLYETSNAPDQTPSRLSCGLRYHSSFQTTGFNEVALPNAMERIEYSRAQSGHHTASTTQWLVANEALWIRPMSVGCPVCCSSSLGPGPDPKCLKYSRISAVTTIWASVAGETHL